MLSVSDLCTCKFISTKQYFITSHSEKCMCCLWKRDGTIVDLSSIIRWYKEIYWCKDVYKMLMHVFTSLNRSLTYPFKTSCSKMNKNKFLSNDKKLNLIVLHTCRCFDLLMS